MQSPWILVLCHEFPPLGGGAGKNLYLLCRELSRRGLRVKVWTGDPGPAKRWRHDDFEVEYFPVGRKARFETNLLGLLAFALGAVVRAWRSRDESPALVFSNLGIPAGLAGTWISRRLKTPHAVWYQGSDVHAGSPAGCGRLQRMILRRVLEGAARNFFVSPGLRDMALSSVPAAGDGKARSAGNPHSADNPLNAAILPTCPSPEILAAPGEGGLPPGQRYFLLLGRMEPVKNPGILLEAMTILTKKGNWTRRVRMVGNGDLNLALKRAIRVRVLSGCVSLETAVSFEAVPGLLRSAYALVVPSRVEGFNTTILEAARFGVPSVGSDTVGIRDFIRHGETGLLFPEGDAAALAEALEALAADPARRDELGRKARDAARPYRAFEVADTFLREVAAVAPALRLHPEAAA